jgi:hypothetical protein
MDYMFDFKCALADQALDRARYNVSGDNHANLILLRLRAWSSICGIGSRVNFSHQTVILFYKYLSNDYRASVSG